MDSPVFGLNDTEVQEVHVACDKVDKLGCLRRLPINPNDPWYILIVVGNEFDSGLWATLLLRQEGARLARTLRDSHILYIRLPMIHWLEECGVKVEFSDGVYKTCTWWIP